MIRSRTAQNRDRAATGKAASYSISSMRSVSSSYVQYLPFSLMNGARYPVETPANL